jgi:hypothetical protein
VDGDAPFPMRLHRVFFPGWQALVDNRRVPTRPYGLLGLVTADVPAGAHEVRFQFGDTSLRLAALAISCAGLLVLALALVRARRRRVLAIVLVVTGVLLGAMVLRQAGPGAAVRRPVALATDPQGPVQLLGYHLPAKTWLPGAALPVHLYWFTREALPTDYTVMLRLVTPDGARIVAESTERPILGSSPTTRWEPGEVTVDEHQLRLDPATPPGTYRLLAALYRPDTGERLRVTAGAQESDRWTALTDLVVGAQ